MQKLNTITDLELEIKSAKTRNLGKYLSYIIDNIEVVGTNTILEQNYEIVKREMENRNVNTKKYVKKYENAKSSPE